MQVKIVDYSSPTAPVDFAEALHEIGFAVVSNHPISKTLVEDAYELWNQFFHSDEKYKFPFNPETHDGYISPKLSERAKGYGIKDIKEFYHYYAWGRCPAALRPLTSQLAQELTDMASQLLQWVQKNTPFTISEKFSMPLDRMIENSEQTLFRLIHYPPLTGNEPSGAVRAAAHEDINLLTLLATATAKGLQVQDINGNWLEVPCNPGWIVVNAGDMLQECSEGYYPSTTHRVVNPTGEEAKKSRLAMPLFLHPRDEVRLSERYTAGSYLQERLQELGLV